MINKNIKTILFDYDGTLVDTESISMKLYPIAFNKFGFKITKRQALQLRSAGYPLKQQLLNKWFGNRLNKQIEKKLFSYFLGLFDQYITKNPIQLKPKVIETFKYLNAKHIPIVIVTATNKDRVEKQMKQLDIFKYVSCIYSTQAVKLGKPNPDVYLYTCKQIKLDPSQCIAVEDSPNGIISACKAGCRTIMVPDLTLPTKQLSKSYKFKVIKSLDKIKNII